MGSIGADAQLYGTLIHPVQRKVPEYDPLALEYRQVPKYVLERAVERRYAIDDIRDKVFDETGSIEHSRAYLRSHGYTAVKHRTALHEKPYGKLSDFRDVRNMNEIYYPELEELVKRVTGCSRAFVENSIVRGTKVGGDGPPMTWERANSGSQLRMHMPGIGKPARVPHWDFNARGARENIRKLSREMEAHARERGILEAEDRIAAPFAAFDKESDAAISAQYAGPRYAIFSVWRPIKKITRDPLVMVPYHVARADPDLVYDKHSVRLPGENGDWYRDVPSLWMKQENADKPGMKEGKLRWEYVSELDTDEVLFIKLFDSAALDGQAEATGEANGVCHGSPDIGERGYGETRESMECRVDCFW